MTTDLRERLLDWLDASPSELVGLLVLLAGSLVVTALVVRGADGTANAVGPAASVVVSEPAHALTVHVVGEVTAPGVVALAAGARVRDAIAAAGGPTAAARLEAVNLARPVHDGEQLVVPGPAPSPGSATSTPPEPSAIDDEGRVDLNRATAADLETLPGIGPVLAERIVSHRDVNGPFTHAGELREVAGIGERTFQALVELVVVR